MKQDNIILKIIYVSIIIEPRIFTDAEIAFSGRHIGSFSEHAFHRYQKCFE